jgi:hypothetical protein
MACCKGTVTDPEGSAKNDEINKLMQEGRKLRANEIKLLLLGTTAIVFVLRFRCW